jgi:hypothetical protein
MPSESINVQYMLFATDIIHTRSTSRYHSKISYALATVVEKLYQYHIFFRNTTTVVIALMCSDRDSLR